MSRDIKAQLKSLKHSQVEPSSDWISSNRALLLSQIKNTVDKKSTNGFDLNHLWSGLSIFMPQSLVLNVVRPIAVLLIVTMVGTSGWIATVDASYESLPGEWLYPAKRAMEKTQVAVASVTGNEKAVTKLHAEFAKRRATEVKKIIVSNEPVSSGKIQTAVQDLKNEIQNVNVTLDQMKANSDAGNEVPAETVKEVKTTTDEVKAVLESIKNNLQSATGSDSNLKVTVAEVKDLAKDTAVKAVEVMVDKHLSGDNTVTKEEVKKELDKTLASAATDIVENKQNVEGVKTIVDAVTVEVKGLVKDNTACRDASQCPSNVTSTKELTATMVEIASSTKAATIKTDAAAVDGDKKIAEAKVMLGQNDLSGAVDKVKELTEVSKSAEKIKDTALQTVQNVIPVVNVVKDAAAAVFASGTPKVEVVVTTTPVGAGVMPVIKEIKLVTSTKK